jgi:hypothetical protein
MMGLVHISLLLMKHCVLLGYSLLSQRTPPLDIIDAFFKLHGHPEGGCVQTDQGGELASSAKFGDLILQEY